MQLYNSSTHYTLPPSNEATLAFTSRDDQGLLPQILSITNLPIELMQKVAFQLNPKDYENLRKTCLTLNNKLPDINKIFEKLDNGKCRGEYRENLQNVSLYHLRNYLQSKDGEKNFHALNSVNIKKSENKIIIGYEDHVNPALDDATKIFQWNLSNKNKNFTPYLTYSSGKTSVILDGGQLTEKSTADIFHSLNKIHKYSEGVERDFIAILAVKIKDVICESPPTDVSKNTLEGIFSDYPEMFNNGEGVRYILQKEKETRTFR